MDKDELGNPERVGYLQKQARILRPLIVFYSIKPPTLHCPRLGENIGAWCEVGDWIDITQVAAVNNHTVGLRSDGTMVAVGWNDEGQCDVNDWDLF
jgi:hypothetical protein